MGNRISSNQWIQLRDKFPEQISQLYSITLPMDFRSINTFAKNAKDNNLKFNQTNPLVSLIDWCVDALEDNFYVRRARTGRLSDGVVFYFFNENDAFLFKLTWWDGS